jgi:vanillate monooxygenase ferredoxin subunit
MIHLTGEQTCLGQTPNLSAPPLGSHSIKPTWIQVVVTQKRREATDIYSFHLAKPEGDVLPSFAAGAHIDVEVAPGLVRQYSLCNSSDATDHYEIALLRENASRGGSQTMADTINVGATLRISEPRNHFQLARDAKRSVLIAGGIGVTPLLSMAKWLCSTGEDFVMHYAARSRDRLAFHDEIAGSAFAHRVFFHLDDGPVNQRLDISTLLADPAAGNHLYVCGPAGLIEAVLSAARANGWPEGQVHREFFSLPTEDVSTAYDVPFEVRLARSGQVFTIPEHRTIAEILEEAGIEIPVSCEQGVCGTCLTRVLEGIPDHRDVFLTAEEHARNNQITPCCSRAKTALLVLDI